MSLDATENIEKIIDNSLNMHEDNVEIVSQKDHLYMYNLKASDIYLNTKFGKEYFDKKFHGINIDQWLTKSLVDKTLDLVKIAPKQIPDDKIYKHLITVSFNNVAKDLDGKTLLNTIALRELFYKDGFDLNDKHYVRYKRSSGSSREGKCLFIEERLSKTMIPWSKCGLTADDEYKKDLVSFEAYQSLSLSGCEKVIELNPHNILVVEDFSSIFKDKNSIGVGTKDKNPIIVKDQEIEISNSIWDGEGLLDVSVFNENNLSHKGMMLLRNRFFKCCAFNTNLQLFLNEMKEQGVINDVSDLNGYTEAKSLDEIKLVITHSSLKYLKLSGKPLNEKIHKWMENVSSTFGIVKTDKPTREFGGRLVDTSYQFINTIGMSKEEVEELVRPYLDYRSFIRDDADFYRFYSRMHKRGDSSKRVYVNSKKEEVAYEAYLDYREMFQSIANKLINYNTDFEKTKLYGLYVSKLMEHFREDAYVGRILIEGTYATLFGNGYELLLNIVGKFNKIEPKSLINQGQIMCKHFADGENIVGARSPHITMGNLYLCKNKIVPEIDKYFNLSNEIVVINAINENIQQKLNGADYDSDTMLLTNNKIIVNAVTRNYSKFKVPVCLASSVNLTHNSSKQNLYKELARIDNDIANNKIGEIVNLSQILNSVYWDKFNNGETKDLDELYSKICILAVLSGMEIDKAKRSYDILVDKVLHSIREYVDNFTNKKKPLFFYSVNKSSAYSYEFKDGKKKSKLSQSDYIPFKTPMDFLVSVVKENPLVPSNRRKNRLSISDLVNHYHCGGTALVFIKDYLNLIKNLQKTIDQLYKEFSSNVIEEAIVYGEIDYKLSQAVEILKNNLRNPATLYGIIRALETDKECDKIILLGLYLVMEDKNQSWKEVIVSKKPKTTIVEASDGDFRLFGKNYKKVLYLAQK